MSTSSTASKFRIHTDGSCLGNPGPGGWAAVIEDAASGAVVELVGGEASTTNNRMELEAAIRAFDSLPRSSRVSLTSDSKYLIQGFTEWMPRWRANGWRTAKRQPVVNQEVWQRLATAADGLSIEWHWVRGHTGHAGNERADTLALEAAEAAQRGEGLD